jgi:N-methylhydantoinase B
MPSKFMRRVARGEVFRAEMAAGGGYGDPLERSIEAVAEDVKQGKITPAHALREYAVTFDAGRPVRQPRSTP